jgi:hypothetical protein
MIFNTGTGESSDAAGPGPDDAVVSGEKAATIDQLFHRRCRLTPDRTAHQQYDHGSQFVFPIGLIGSRPT